MKSSTLLTTAIVCLTASGSYAYAVGHHFVVGLSLGLIVGLLMLRSSEQLLESIIRCNKLGYHVYNGKTYKLAESDLVETVEE